MPRRIGRVLLLGAGLVAFAVACTELGVRAQYRNDTVRTFFAQARAWLSLRTDYEGGFHPSLAPRLIHVGGAVPETTAAPKRYVVASFNMAAGNSATDLGLALRSLGEIREKHDPDILFLTEAPGDIDLYRSHEAFADLAGIYAWDRLRWVDPERSIDRQGRNFERTGNVLLSRLPIRDPRIVILPKVEENFPDVILLRNALLARIGALTAVNVHLAAHTRPRGRLKQVEAILPFLDATSVPGGDWNFFHRHLGDAFEPGYSAMARHGFADTLTKEQRFLHRSRLNPIDRMFAFADHVFVPSGGARYEAEILPAPGSDHDVILARITLAD